MKTKAMLVGLLVVSTVFAQTGSSSKRLVQVQGAPIGDPIKGPLTFKGNPVRGSISTLQIQAAQAVLTPPPGKTFSESKGQLKADFDGGVTVTRGRLTAKGDKLAYSEATGQGVMTGNPSATFVPDKKDAKDKDTGEPVNIRAQQMSLDVDTNVSTSTGNVQLVQGNQTGKAEKLIFDEDKELAQLTGNPTLTRAAKANQKELIISGKEVRALTKNKTLYVTGGVKLVQGTLTTTGESVYYDDKKDVAYIVGNAVSIDSKNKVTVRGNTLRQLTDRASVTQYSGAYKIPTEQFKLATEK